MPKTKCRSRKGTASRSAGAVAHLVAALAALVPISLTPAAMAGVPGVKGPASGARGPAVRPVTLLPGSTITFHASDALGGFDGGAPISSISISMDPRHLARTSGSVHLMSDAVTTGNFLRDVNAHRTVFEVSRYPTISYSISAVEAHPSALADGRAVDVVVRGKLRMHGVDRDVAATGRITRSGNRLDATLSMQVRLSDFNMTRPRLFTVVVADVIQVRVHLVLQMQPERTG